MNATITAYIGFRYPNWMDYARHQCRVQHLEGWECDLMNDIIADLLRKPESKIADLMSRETRKIVNGRPTTELDKFVLKMIKVNACSKFASFRKNTLGQKITGKSGAVVEVATFCELSTLSEQPDECTYNSKHYNQLDQMHRENINTLHMYGFSGEVCRLYQAHFIEATKPRNAREKMIIEQITQFLTKNKTYGTSSASNQNNHS